MLEGGSRPPPPSYQGRPVYPSPSLSLSRHLAPSSIPPPEQQFTVQENNQQELYSFISNPRTEEVNNQGKFIPIFKYNNVEYIRVWSRNRANQRKYKMAEKLTRCAMLCRQNPKGIFKKTIFGVCLHNPQHITEDIVVDYQS